jgi:hypothetical protein
MCVERAWRDRFAQLISDKYRQKKGRIPAYQTGPGIAPAMETGIVLRRGRRSVSGLGSTKGEVLRVLALVAFWGVSESKQAPPREVFLGAGLRGEGGDESPYSKIQHFEFQK